MSEMSCHPSMLPESLRRATPGDVLALETGSFANLVIQIDACGEPDAPVTIRAATSGETVFTGASSLRLTGSHVVLEGLRFEGCILEDSCVVLDGAADCTVRDCRFERSGGKRAAVTIQGTAKRNTVEGCTFAHLEQRSIQVVIRGEDAPQDNAIVGNTFSDIPPIPSGNGRETIQVGQNQRDWGHVEPRTTIERNRFLRCDGEIEIISNKSSRNVYRHNLFKDCRGELVMRGGSFCQVIANRHVNCTGGIRLSGTHHVVSHNQILDCDNGIRIPYGMTVEQGGLYQAVTGCEITRNSIVGTRKTGLALGTNRNMDRGEMGVARFAPFGNRITHNDFASDSGVHAAIDEAPDNHLQDNRFGGKADRTGVPAGNPGEGGEPGADVGVDTAELANTPEA